MKGCEDIDIWLLQDPLVSLLLILAYVEPRPKEEGLHALFDALNNAVDKRMSICLGFESNVQHLTWCLDLAIPNSQEKKYSRC